MGDGLADWRACRRIAQRITGAQGADLDDLASEAVLSMLTRGAWHRRATIDAVRLWRRPPLPLEEEPVEAGPQEADELAEFLAAGSPAWFGVALQCLGRGLGYADAAKVAGRSYDALYSRLRR